MTKKQLEVWICEFLEKYKPTDQMESVSWFVYGANVENPNLEIQEKLFVYVLTDIDASFHLLLVRDVVLTSEQMNRIVKMIVTDKQRAQELLSQYSEPFFAEKLQPLIDAMNTKE